MRRELIMPKLGLTMTEGAFIEWMVRPGESYKEGQSLFVIESEKAAIEIPADTDGVLLEASAQPGATLPIGAVIGYWDDGTSGESVVPPPRTANDAGDSAAGAPATTKAHGSPAGADSRVPVTPLARRIASQRNIDLSKIQGSGPRGRIRTRDLPSFTPAAVPTTASSAPIAAGLSRNGTLQQPSPTEKTIARRLTQAKQEVPHFYLAVEAEVSKLLALRAELNGAQGNLRFTVNHFIIAAVGRALADMPELNRVWTADGILNMESSDVGIAVNTERGLLVPVLRAVGSLSLPAVVREAGQAITQAQAGRLSPADTAGGAITVSNAGMHDVTYMTSIINPGQAMILGVGSVRELFRPDSAGQPALHREMGLVLSADHRVLDGVRALTFLKRIVNYLEQPLALLAS
jgi:pyruvate dehydrogenase E2 component (dihydrolipoamide acetyltransferase)